MYIPIWIIVIAFIFYYFWIKSKRKQKPVNTVEHFEEIAQRFKESLFEFPHFNCPNIVDLQDRYDAMEINYLRLKQRYLSQEENALEIAKDWARYVEALKDLKFANEMLDVDLSDTAYDTYEERTKEPRIIFQEVEKKIKSLLKKDFQELPLTYNERLKKGGKEFDIPSDEEERIMYSDSKNYRKMIEFRLKEKNNYKETS